MAHKSRYPPVQGNLLGRLITAGRAGWGWQAGHLAWEGRRRSPDPARLPARGARGSGTGYAPGGVAGRERLPGRGQHGRRIAGTAHLDRRHGGRRAQGGLPREEGECAPALRLRGLGDSGAGGGWTRGRGWLPLTSQSRGSGLVSVVPGWVS